jgi:hypothetical protein
MIVGTNQQARMQSRRRGRAARRVAAAWVVAQLLSTGCATTLDKRPHGGVPDTAEPAEGSEFRRGRIAADDRDRARPVEAEASAKAAAPFDDAAPAPVAQGAPAGAGGPSARRPTKARPALPAEPAPPPLTASTPTPNKAPAPRQQRKVHYDGYVQLVAKRPEELLARAEELTKAVGGYVESLSGTQLIVRVPVADFRALFEQILELSEVLQQRITARDITDAYQAVELRMRVLEASRSRLMTLLAKVFREHEKLSLLAQIKRLTEQLDQLQLQLQKLARMAAYSRITVVAAPRPQPAAAMAQRELGAFQWIARLSPFRRKVAQEADRFEIQVPKGMVELDHDDSIWGGDPWVAESPDGVTVWTMERDNNPRGSAEFWHAALVNRLSERYPSHESYKIGAFHVLELKEEIGQQKYRYLVAVRVDDDELEVVEIYYPSNEHRERHHRAVERALERS